MGADKAGERRLFSRTRIMLPVYLSRPGQRAQRYHSRDLGSGGVFVQMRSALPARGERVQLTFVLEFEQIIKLYYLSAVVTRVAGDGIGLRFADRQQKQSGPPIHARAD